MGRFRGEVRACVALFYGLISHQRRKDIWLTPSPHQECVLAHPCMLLWASDQATPGLSPHPLSRRVDEQRYVLTLSEKHPPGFLARDRRASCSVCATWCGQHPHFPPMAGRRPTLSIDGSPVCLLSRLLVHPLPRSIFSPSHPPPCPPTPHPHKYSARLSKRKQEAAAGGTGSKQGGEARRPQRESDDGGAAALGGCAW